MQIISKLSKKLLYYPQFVFGKRLFQYEEFKKALNECGLEVLVLEKDEKYPDSTLVEDVALLTRDCVIITNPGALSRRGDKFAMEMVMGDYDGNIEEICESGMVEAGDIMIVETHFYIGLLERTNASGAQQVIENLEKYSLSGSVIKLEKVLHLKTGVTYLEQNNLVACGEFLSKAVFQEFNLLEITEDESYAANCIWVNDSVLTFKCYKKARKTNKSAGYLVKEVDVSEFRKLDGGLSFLSRRF